MTEVKFSPGDRVVCVRGYPGLERGEIGTYLGFGRNLNPKDASVRWDKYVERRHSCNRRCEQGYGWFVPVANIAFAEPEDLGELPIADDEEVSKFLFDM